MKKRCENYVRLIYNQGDITEIRVSVKCETKSKRNETKRNKSKRNSPKRNEIYRNETDLFRFVSVNFVSFR